MIETNWYVITGAPSSGKTTLINQLSSSGYTTAPEIAREYINSLLASNQTLKEINDDAAKLQRNILAGALKRERKLQTDQLIFLDRGTPDSLGYFNYYNIKTEHLIHPCQRIRYKKLFYCHQLPMEYDSVRIEDNLSAAKIGQLIYKAYRNLGYELIELPAISIKERIEMILNQIE